jgi:AcrR family transcriptional regulator
MGEFRDAARTRRKIMEAARDEFAERGFAGARIESIARRAGVAKQLLYHYFPGKEALFEATLADKFQQQRPATAAGDGPAALFRERFRRACEDPVWVRFLTWEAAENREGEGLIAETARREAMDRQAAAFRARQAAGDLPDDMPTEMLQLAVYALTTYPVAYAQLTELVTGRNPQDPQFQADWTAFLSLLAERLARK